MKYVFTASQMSPDGSMVKSLLEEAGIPCLMRNEHLSSAAGEMGLIPLELWILNDDDYPRAKEIVDDWKNSDIEDHGSWVCRCGETIEGQFTSCWKCGRERPAA